MCINVMLLYLWGHRRVWVHQSWQDNYDSLHFSQDCQRPSCSIYSTRITHNVMMVMMERGDHVSEVCGRGRSVLKGGCVEEEEGV